MSPFIPKLDTIDEDAPLVHCGYDKVEVNDTNSNNGVTMPMKMNVILVVLVASTALRLTRVDDLIDSIISVNTQVVKFFINSSAIGGDPAHHQNSVQITQPTEPSASAYYTSSQPDFFTSLYSSVLLFFVLLFLQRFILVLRRSRI